jgi:hypothetical protein
MSNRTNQFKRLWQLIGLSALIRALQIAALYFAARAHHRTLFNIYGRWDAQWYQSIAVHGYGAVIIDQHGRHLSNLAFFPLFPLLERATHLVVGGNYFVAGVYFNLLAWLFAIAGIYSLAKLLVSEASAFYTALLWSALPIALVESLSYSESLFTALAAWSLYYSIRERYYFASLLAALAGATRPIGLAVVLAIWFTVMKSGKSRVEKLISAVIAPLGFLGYFFFVSKKRHSLFGYFQVQSDWGNSLDFGKHFALWIWRYLTHGLVLGLLLISLVLLLGLWSRRAFLSVKVASIRIYLIVLLLQAMTTASYFGSKPRYLLPAFPLLIPLAQRLERFNLRTQRLLLSLFTLAGVVYGAFWLTGHGPP